MVPDDIVLYPLKWCPWCRKTPELGFFDLKDETWMPHIRCNSDDCPVNPHSHPVPIRKKQKKQIDVLKRKFEMCVDKWNEKNSMSASYALKVNFADMINFGEKR